MTLTVKNTRVESLLESASASLKSSEWFEAERLAMRGIQLAHADGQFGLIARIALPLQEARRQRIQLALDARKKVVVMSSGVTEEMKIESGCYLLEPPLVGADARRLRLSALAREIPVAVMCREPMTLLRLTPIVSIGEITVRTRIDPPKKPEAPDMKWFVRSMRELGDAAIGMLDTGLEASRQVDAVLAFLDSVPDHEALHQVLADVCRLAEREAAEAPVRKPKLPKADADSGAAEDAAD
ncbi:MAG: hypothetical protein EXS00_00605 [Phycisphaerales bacterium]|nr:hypothetical protein [Phycisphaerales bacterium]